MNNEVIDKIEEAFRNGTDGVLVTIHYQEGDKLQHYYYRGNSMSKENALSSLKNTIFEFEGKEV